MGARAAIRQTGDPLCGGLVLELELENSGETALVFSEIVEWDTDLPDHVSHSNLSGGEVRVRHVGEPEPDKQRYSCVEGTAPAPAQVHLAPGERTILRIGLPEIGDLPPGEYDVRVQLYCPPCESNWLRVAIVGIG